MPFDFWNPCDFVDCWGCSAHDVRIMVLRQVCLRDLEKQLFLLFYDFGCETHV